MRRGFTIVELLIVIVVIAILAGLVIVSYNGITRQAIESSLEYDVKNASNQIEVGVIQGNAAYPDTELDISGGLRSSGDNVLSYTKLSDGYCIEGVNAALSEPVRYISTLGVLENEECPRIVTVTTVAGSGSYGNANGAALTAQFISPRSIATAPDGRLFIADYDAHRIRMLSADGATVSTYAGAGSAGLVDGASGSAQFRNPDRMETAPDGRLFIADSVNHRVRVVSADGSTVSTYAGSGATGYGNGAYVDGDALTTARFHNVKAVAVGPDGTVYVADYENDRIRAISTGGAVSTFAGAGQNGSTDGDRITTARFNGPGSLAVASDGTVYVGDQNNNRIRMIATNGTVSTLAGSSSGFVDGVGAAARFDGVDDIVLSSDETVLYIADSGNDSLRALDLDTLEVTTFAGTGVSGEVDGLGEVAQFDSPNGIALDADGNLYVNDRGNRVIRYVTTP